jgi:hypothetical protein
MKNLHKQNGWIIALIVLIAVNFIAAQVHPACGPDGRKALFAKQWHKGAVTQPRRRTGDPGISERRLPGGFRKLSNTTQEFVALLRETNRSRIRYYFTAPDEEAGNGKTWADSLAAAGIAPINLTVQVKTGQENKLVFP